MTGLILEGGGMRGAFTAGVLDAFLSENIHFNSVYGISAGASNGASYIARQQGRNRKVFVDGVKNHRYFSLKNLLSQRNLLDINLLFDHYPNNLIPFDFDTFENSPSLFFTGLTDCSTGEPVFIERKEVSRTDFMMKVLAGSNSLPLVSPPVQLEDKWYLDGGLSDSVPLERAMKDGCRKNVIILTRKNGYRKEKSGISPLVKAVYRRYPGIVSCFENRHNAYNNTMDFCAACEDDGSARILRPETTFGVSRIENNYGKLENLYQHGFKTGIEHAPSIKTFLTG